MSAETFKQQQKKHWNEMIPNNLSKAGNKEHQNRDEEIWKKIFSDYKLDDFQNLNFRYLEFCVGDGRLLR